VEAKARYRAVKIQPQWVVTPGKQALLIIQESYIQSSVFRCTVSTNNYFRNLILFVSCIVTTFTHIHHQIRTFYKKKSAVNRHTQGDIKMKEYKIVFTCILHLDLSLFKTLYMNII